MKAASPGKGSKAKTLGFTRPEHQSACKPAVGVAVSASYDVDLEDFGEVGKRQQVFIRYSKFLGWEVPMKQGDIMALALKVDENNHGYILDYKRVR